MNQQQWTGERLETFVQNETMIEHLHRYAIVQSFAAGKKILDIACGEGYGTHLLSQNALHVTGADIDAATIEKARTKYKNLNTTFVTCSVTQTPFSNQEFDIIVCFETLEHVDDHEKTITELKRILKPGGFLFISTPEKLNYSDKTGYKNAFHKKELYESEFKKLVSSNFSFTRFYKQFSFTGSAVLNENDPSVHTFFKGDYTKTETNVLLPVMYRVALASDTDIPPIPSSLFQNPSLLSAQLKQQEEQVKQTMTYKLGHFILYPFKKIRSLLQR